jgi:hypothetical protein
MKNIVFIAVCFLIASSSLFAQAVDLQEKTPYQNNGLEYGYYITNEKSKDVKGDDMDRYGIVLYVTNRSNSFKFIPFPNMDNVTDQVTVAEFSCKNATGKRLTSKNGKVGAKPWFTQVRIADETQSSKYRFVKAQIGYAIKNGETLSTKIIVIVPKDERPVVTCRTVDYPDFAYTN